jgi:predicted DNA-binding transcriptional regulator AlpA
MTRKRIPDQQLPLHALHPDHFYRFCEGPHYFGYAPAQLLKKIQTGEIPRPVSLSDTGRARGWFGRSIIRWQAEREAKPAPKGKAAAKPTRKSARAAS